MQGNYYKDVDLEEDILRARLKQLERVRNSIFELEQAFRTHDESISNDLYRSRCEIGSAEDKLLRILGIRGN